MGMKMDAMLGKKFKPTKFKSLVNLALARIAFLEKQHTLQSSQARSDAIQLLDSGHQERALLRVEQFIREQNMLEVYAMIQNYFNLLVERLVLIIENKKYRECPGELKEAISSLIFAASRCGELPELKKISTMFTSSFGREFTARAVEVRINCGVCPKMVNKLSTQQPSLDRKLNVLKEIALKNTINLHSEENGIKEVRDCVEETKLEPIQKQKKLEHNEPPNVINGLCVERNNQDVKLLETMKEKTKYGDFESAAQAAYLFAAHAAIAARAAVEFSQSEIRNNKTS